MEEKQKNAVMIAIITGLLGFNIMWWSFDWLWGGILGILLGALFAAAGYFGTQFLS